MIHILLQNFCLSSQYLLLCFFPKVLSSLEICFALICISFAQGLHSHTQYMAYVMYIFEFQLIVEYVILCQL